MVEQYPSGTSEQPETHQAWPGDLLSLEGCGEGHWNFTRSQPFPPALVACCW